MTIAGVGAPSVEPTSKGALQAAARQLEAVFVNLMFEEMAKTVGDGGLFPKAPGADMYQQWFRGAVADKWTAAGGTGLGDAIAASLGGQTTAGDVKLALQRASGAPAAPRRRGLELGDTVRWPVAGRISSAFGHRAHPVHGGEDHHSGVDIAAPMGTPVRMPFSGRVAEVGESATLGRYVVVEHQGGYRSVFGHLEDASVAAGTPVRAGDVVATSGNSGRSTGPHLHYGLYRNGRAVDPTPHLR